MNVILHLGLGSFHRAHQAVYLQALHDRGDRRWELAGGHIRADMPEAAHAMCDAADPVAAFCADPLLWGLLACDARLVDALRGASARVERFVEQHRV